MFVYIFIHLFVYLLINLLYIVCLFVCFFIYLMHQDITTTSVYDGTKTCTFIYVSAKSFEHKDLVEYKSLLSVFVVFHLSC